MAMHDASEPTPAPVTDRVDALEKLLVRKGLLPDGFIDEFSHRAQEDWIPRNGARVIARAWSDAAFKQRLLQNGKAAVAELGFILPDAHKHLVVLENTANVHNVIVCTLCSCTAFTLLGLPPDWYKNLEYRARAVRESRTVLKEMGLELRADMEIRVWDTTADTRYMVMPVRPPSTQGWSEAALADVVTKESMIGVARL